MAPTVLSPRLSESDLDTCLMEPMCSAFKERKACKRESRVWMRDWTRNLIKKLMDESRPKVEEWGVWCTGLHLEDDILFPLYIEVLWSRSLSLGFSEALKLLGNAQTQSIKAKPTTEQEVKEGSNPVDVEGPSSDQDPYHDAVELLERQAEESALESSTESCTKMNLLSGYDDLEQGFEYNETDTVHEEDIGENSSAPFSAPPLALSKKEALNIRIKGNPAVQIEVCQGFERTLSSYLFCTPENWSDEISNKHASCITCVLEMRAISKRVYTEPSWLNAIHKSKLSDLFQRIGDPGIDLDSSGDHSREQGLWCRWQDVLTDIDSRWTPIKLNYKIATKPATKGTIYKGKAEIFMKLLKDENRLLPFSREPTSIFMFCSLPNFQEEWQAWFLPSLLKLSRNGYDDLQDAQQWDHESIYRWILQRINDNTLNSEFGLESPLADVVEETALFVKYRKDMRSKIYRPQRQAESSTEEQSYDSPVPHLEPSNTSSGCQNCKNLDRDNHCLRQFVVNRAHDAFKYENSVLTNAEPDDLLKPKLSKTLGKAKATHSMENLAYVSVRELGMKKITSRPAVKERCGKDVNHIYDSDDNMVGGVAFDALSPENIERVLQHLEDISRCSPITRREVLQLWAYGKLWATGARKPRGGRSGDSYGLYAHHTIATRDGIRALFHHAEDAQLLLEVAMRHCPDLRQDIDSTTKRAIMKRLGSTGCNTLYFKKYMSSIHKDHDKTMAITAQLRRNAKCDEFHFAFVDWGFYIETEVGAVWWFNSEDLHGTIMPRGSSISEANSDGFQVTLRAATYESAAKQLSIRAQYPERAAYWKSFQCI